MKNITLLIALIMLSQTVNAGAFMLQWEDIFPMCAKTNTDYNPIRCGSEFLIPNFHLGLMFSMISNIVTSFFLIEDIAAFTNLFLSNPINAVGGILSDIADTFLNFFNTTDDVSSIDVLSGLFSGFLSWIFGIITPFMIILMIIYIEFIKTYLILAIAFMLWTYVLQELNLMGGTNPAWGLYIALFTIVLMFFGTLWLLASDLGLYSPLIIW